MTPVTESKEKEKFFSQLEKIYFKLKNMDSELAAKIRKELKAYMIAVFPIEAGVK